VGDGGGDQAVPQLEQPAEEEPGAEGEEGPGEEDGARDEVHAAEQDAGRREADPRLQGAPEHGFFRDAREDGEGQDAVHGQRAEDATELALEFLEGAQIAGQSPCDDHQPHPDRGSDQRVIEDPRPPEVGAREGALPESRQRKAENQDGHVDHGRRGGDRNRVPDFREDLRIDEGVDLLV